MWKCLSIVPILWLWGCGATRHPALDATAPPDSQMEMPSEGGNTVCVPAPQAYFIGDPPPACCSTFPRVILLYGTMISKNRVYDSQGTLLDADETAVITDVWFATSDPGPGDDAGGDYSFRILSESGEVMWAAWAWDPFRCFDCPKGHTPITEVSDQWSAPLVRGMAFFEIRDKRLDKMLLLLDVRGFVQVFCMNNPCVDICQPESIDGGTTEAGVPMVDSG